jgi:hypothetical protein
MVAKASRNYKLTNMETGFNRVVEVFSKEQLEKRIARFLKDNGIERSELLVEPSEVTYARRYLFEGKRFYSKAMMWRYQDLMYLQATGAIKNLKFKPKYTLIEGFTYDGEEYTSVYYTAEYEYYDTIKERVIIEDYRNAKVGWSRIEEHKLKLFLYLYKDIAEIKFIDTKDYNPILEKPIILNEHNEINGAITDGPTTND